MSQRLLRTSIRNGAQSAANEQGFAMLWTILLLIVMVGVTGVIITAARGAIQQVAQAEQLTSSNPGIQTGISTYLVALRTSIAREWNAYTITDREMCGLIGEEPTASPNPPCANVLNNNAYPVTTWPAWARSVDADLRPGTDTSNGPYGYYGNTGMPSSSAYRYTVRIPSDTNQPVVYWQIYGILPPNFHLGAAPSTTNLVIYIRSWVGEPAANTKPTISRVELRPGYFSDYQILTQGPVQLEKNATINGPIHSNGFLDTLVDPRSTALPVGAVTPPTDTPLNDVRIWSVGKTPATNVQCVGDFANLSTARGTIDSDIPTGPIGTPDKCHKEAGTNRFINFLGIENVVGRDRADCALVPPAPLHQTVYCFNSTSPTGIWEVTARQHGAIDITSPTGVITHVEGWGPGWPLASENGAPRTFVFDRSIQLSVEGTPSVIGRQTFIAWTTAAAALLNVPTASIYLESDIIGSGSGQDYLGMIAQGDIVTDINGAGICKVHTIKNAALIAASGSLTIPPDFATGTAPGLTKPHCGTLVVSGSLAVRHAPLLYWGWDFGATYAGYLSRKYQWTAQLATTPPTSMPTAEGWRVVRLQPADADCLFGHRFVDWSKTC